MVEPHGISYNEMPVLYTLREKGLCTQKQICDNHHQPRQTMNNVISCMQESGVLSHSPQNCTGREKAYVSTAKGEVYVCPLTAKPD